MSFSQMTAQNAAILLMAILCVVVSFDTMQLAFALFGALVYAALQKFNPLAGKTRCQLAAEREERERKFSTHRATRWPASVKRSATRSRQPGPTQHQQQPTNTGAIKPDVYQPSTKPVTAPTFQSTAWEAEVDELISQIIPGRDEDQAVQRLALHVKAAIGSLLPEVEVNGFAQGSLKYGKAFGVAVPEVDIVASVNPAAVNRRSRHYVKAQQMDARQLQKWALRGCIDRLVTVGGFKFRRSAFQGEEPKATLVVPVSLGFFTDPIPVDFSVNTVTPFYTAALLTECSQIEPRAKALILLVKRWAKDRGICHGTKGHLSPYLWSLLAIYFMQVGVEGPGPLLPALHEFAMSSGLMPRPSSSKCDAPNQKPLANKLVEDAMKLSIGQLFCEFVNFYRQHFNWRDEAISVRLGRRAPPSISLPLHIVLSEDHGTHDVGLAIEDPFKAGNNLGACMNAMSLARLREELARASDLCTRGASLTELLEPWVPPDDGRSSSILRDACSEEHGSGGAKNPQSE